VNFRDLMIHAKYGVVIG